MAVIVFALNEYFHNKSGQVVLIVLVGGALAFLGALIYVHGYLWLTEKLGYRAGPRSFKLTVTSTGTVFFTVGCMGLRSIQRAVLNDDFEELP